MFGAALGLAPTRLLARTSANDKLDVAFIGVFRRGAHNLMQMTKSGEVNVAAICDVNSTYLAGAAAQYPKARQFDDFRRLYDNAHLFDAVVVSIPEHGHAFATMPALELGKHVYCEKPLTHNIRESRRISEAASRSRVATQMGTQNHANPNYHRVVELIQSGAIGPVREAHTWVSRAWGLQSKEESERNNDVYYVANRPAAQQPPADLDWNLWLNAAPARPFTEAYYPGPRWYRWWDFANGTMSDLGSHSNDLPYWALKLDAPHAIEAFGPPPHPEIAPASMRVVYDYAARADMPACRMTWYQGTEKPALWTAGKIPQWKDGTLFVGDKGMLLAHYTKHVLLPEEQFVDFTPPTPWIPDSPGHHQEWVNSCRTGAPTGSPFAYAGALTEANHLGNVAYRVGKRILWDRAAMRATNAPEADAFIGRDPRAGWSL